MSEMKLIMERWSHYVADATNPITLLLEAEEDPLEALKKQPKEVAALIQQASQERDREKLAQLARLLWSDPDIRSAANAMKNIPDQVEDLMAPGAEATADLNELEILDKLAAKGVAGMDKILQNPTVRKVLPLGAAIIALGGLAAALTGVPELADVFLGPAGAAKECSTGDAATCIGAVASAIAMETGGTMGDISTPGALEEAPAPKRARELK